MEGITQVLGLLAVLGLVIFAAYFMTKYLANKAAGGRGKTRYFNVIDRFSVSKDKMFVLVAVGQTVYIIGVTNQGMTLLDQIALSELPAEDELMKKTAFPGFLSGLKSTRPFGAKSDGVSFSDFIRQARQKDDEHDQ